MLLRAKIRSGEEDLSVFEAQLLEDNGLQRAHSSPTLQDSSQASQISQASSTRDGGNSSKASACSSKPRQEGQRHSYRQAVKKWDGAGAPGAARRCTASGRLSPCKGFYFRSRRVWSSAWRGSRSEGLPHTLPQPWRPTRHPNLLINRGGADPVTGIVAGQHQQGCWCRRWEDQLGGHRSAEMRCLRERTLVRQQTELWDKEVLIDWTRHPSSILSFSPPFVLLRHLSGQVLPPFFLTFHSGPNMFTHLNITF